jgi:A/G-specific adenine glycosylase
LGNEPELREKAKRVINWEKQHWIPYPWRTDRTPYKVLIAEVLLKRTTRQAVAREFLRFMARFPDIEPLYRAPMEEVEEALRHLGLKAL